MDAWQKLKQDPKVSWYPSKPFDVPADKSCWFTEAMRKGVTEVVSKLPANSVVIELGVFTGAGSTSAILEANDNVKVVCVDNFKIRPNMIAVKERPKVATPFYRGIGTAWEHFINNTWAHRSRIIPIAAQTDPPTLKWLKSFSLDVSVIYLDSDHDFNAVFPQLVECCKLWPSALLLIDDYHPPWPGVKRAVDKAIVDKIIDESDVGELYDNRLLTINGKAR